MSKLTGHINPFVDIEIIISELSNHFPVYKRPPTHQAGRQELSPFHYVNFSSALLTPIVTLFILNIKNAGRWAITL
jgi:hypothetical protein